MKRVTCMLIVAILALADACTFQMPEVRQGSTLLAERINSAENMVIKRKFARAQTQFNDLLKDLFPGTPEHEVVLYNLILLNLNRDNPHANPSRAKQYMDDFLKIYPRSHFRTAIFVLERTCRESENLKACRNEVHHLKKSLKNREDSIKKLQSEIEAYKKIDWEREEKKRQIQK